MCKDDWVKNGRRGPCGKRMGSRSCLKNGRCPYLGQGRDFDRCWKIVKKSLRERRNQD